MPKLVNVASICWTQQLPQYCHGWGYISKLKGHRGKMTRPSTPSPMPTCPQARAGQWSINMLDKACAQSQSGCKMTCWCTPVPPGPPGPTKIGQCSNNTFGTKGATIFSKNSEFKVITPRTMVMVARRFAYTLLPLMSSSHTKNGQCNINALDTGHGIIYREDGSLPPPLSNSKLHWS